MLVLLRIYIGWHFLYEGVWKLEHPSFSAEPFLRQAQGPFRERFRNLVPDIDGRQRLNLVPQPGGKFNAELSDEVWNDYWRKMSEFYRFDDKQKEEAQRLHDRADQRLKGFLIDNQETIAKYFQDLDRLEKDQQDPAIRDMPYRKKRTADDRSKLAAQSAPWLAQIDEMDEEFRHGIEALLTEPQKLKGRLPGSRTALEISDDVIKYGVTAIGICLLAGFLTRFSCLAGAAFLLSVILAQPAWPGGFPPPHPSAGHAWIVNKEFIEMAALLALATTRVGRWGGLDFFVHYLIVRPVFGGRKKNESKS